MADHEAGKSNPEVELIDLIDVNGSVVVQGLPFSEAMAQIADDFEANGESRVGVSVVHVWLARSNGADHDPVLIFQERSDNHRLDKTVGGHISSGKSETTTLLDEVNEEMGIGAVIVDSLGQGALAGIGLSRDAMVVDAGIDPWQISGRHTREGLYFEKPTRVQTYIGFFDGDLGGLKSDSEVDGFVEMSLSQILEGLAENPDRFTPDVVALVESIGERIKAAASE